MMPLRAINTGGESTIQFREQKTEWSFEEYAIKENVSVSTVRTWVLRNQLPANLEVYAYSDRKKVIRIKPLTIADPKEKVIPEKAMKIAAHRKNLVEIFRNFKIVKRDFVIFEIKYNEELQWPTIHAVLGALSARTVYGWLLDYNEHGFEALIPGYNYEARGRAVREEEINAILRHYLGPNQLKIAEAIRAAKRDGVALNKSDKTYTRALNDWVNEHADITIMMRLGMKQFNDQLLPSILRDKVRTELGDIFFADGHVLNFEILNPATGKQQRMVMVVVYDYRSGIPFGWEIMPSESTYSILTALRRGIITMGYCPQIFYIDNGNAFNSKSIVGRPDWVNGVGALSQLGINVMNARAYHGQTKTIERFFGTMGEFERLMISYSGNSIENKPARMARNEVMHKELYEYLMDRDFKGGLTIETVHRAFGYWVNEFINRKATTGVDKGKSPLEVAKESFDKVDKTHRMVLEPQLRQLMLPAEVRAVGKDGIRFLNNHYWSDDFMSLARGEGQHKMVIRYDYADLSKVYVYKNDQFFTIATLQEKYHPAARLLGTHQEEEALNKALKHRESLTINAVATSKELFAEHNSIDNSRAILQMAKIKKQRKAKKVSKTENKKQTHLDEVDYDLLLGGLENSTSGDSSDTMPDVFYSL